MEKILYRSEKDKMIAGVCGGLAKYFDIDPTIIRLMFLFFILWGGGGFLIYLICWIVIPTESSVGGTSEKIIQENKEEVIETVRKTAKGFKTEVKSDTKKEKKNGK